MALYENERVSVIIPVFKVERFIEQTILSVVNQNYPDIEIVLVDDCSPDSSAAIIKNMQEKYTNIVYYKLDKNRGAAVARNKALDMQQDVMWLFWMVTTCGQKENWRSRWLI